MKTIIQKEIFGLLGLSRPLSSRAIHEGLETKVSYATVKRTLKDLLSDGVIEQLGNAKNTLYKLTPRSSILNPIDVGEYFAKEVDERVIKEQFNFDLVQKELTDISLFTKRETAQMLSLHTQFKENVSHLSATEYGKEMGRLAIDLSWKSSQIEGNTYTLLETERLLTDKETAAGKPQSDAIMLLNHKEAINFILDHKDYLHPLSIRAIEDIHSILIKDLGVDRNLRRGRVGVTGTNYKPLDNEHQIREALEDMCVLVNSKSNVFEKALLSLVLLSYIQGFADGNKRTARIVSNAILVANDYCPLSFRTADATGYKKAMLLFYEQNSISAFKQLFMEQYAFAVKTYF